VVWPTAAHPQHSEASHAHLSLAGERLLASKLPEACGGDVRDHTTLLVHCLDPAGRVDLRVNPEGIPVPLGLVLRDVLSEVPLNEVLHIGG
jgi:hypothetical protein